MAVTITEVYNRALLEVGAKRINSPSDQTKEAQIVTLFYPSARDEVLRLHDWNCAGKRATFAALSTTDPFDEWSYLYSLPNDCLRVVKIKDDYPFKVEGRVLYTDQSPAYVKYIRQTPDNALNELDPLVLQLIVLRLAKKIAFSLIENYSPIIGRIENDFASIMAEAKGIDAKEIKNEEKEDEWLADRGYNDVGGSNYLIKGE